MTYEVTITFDCCGNVIRTTNEDGGTGMHTVHCLACDTESPPTSVETKRLR